ncbi:MAG: tetratricopeptide repeat protein [Oscillospiraceae bacterium]|nr:tetratricopeptide repeat protein [Oscillospiraceae bacterium]
MAFDINKFYADLDEYYARHDNAATEQFLKDSLAMSEEYMIIPSSCGSCDDHCDRTGEEKYDQLSDHEKEWIINCSDTRIAVLNEMACFYRGLSKWDMCLTAFDAVKAELEIRGMQNNSAYAVVILNMAGALRLMGKLDEALASFKEAETILLKASNTSDYEMAGLYNNTGLVYQDMGDLASAAENFEKALTYLEKVPDNDAEIATNRANLAVTYYNSGNRERAIEYLNAAISMFENMDGGLNPHYAGALNTKAVMLFNAGDVAGAAETFEKAIEKTKLIFGENKEYAVGCRNASMAFETLGNKEKADFYKKTANEILAKLG